MRRMVLVVAMAFALLPRPATGQASIVAHEVVDGRLHELTVASPVLGREARVRVLLPAGYDDPANAGRRWPILWLLHGVGDDQRSWSERTDVEGLTADLPLVVAMPEAGRNTAAGWYSDWVAGPAWETFHLAELLPLIEERFGAGGARERRVVAGLSMGGYGAMVYAARHPDLWVAAASFSGAVHPTMLGAAGALAFELLGPATGTPGDPIWGPYETSQATWHGHDPFDLAANLRSLGGLYLRTGNGIPCPGDSPTSAPLEVGVYPMNLTLHARLSALGIGHTWFDRGCGTHEWRHWEDDLAATLPAFMAVLADPPPAPAVFSHRFVDDTALVFGWRFTITDRSQPDLTVVQDVSADGLTVSGAGRLSVTTPAGFAFAVDLAQTPIRLTLPAAAPAPVPAPTAPPPSTTTTTTVPRPVHAGPTLPTTGADGDGGLALAAVAIVVATLARALSGAGAGGRRPTRSG